MVQSIAQGRLAQVSCAGPGVPQNSCKVHLWQLTRRGGQGTGVGWLPQAATPARKHPSKPGQVQPAPGVGGQ